MLVTNGASMSDRRLCSAVIDYGGGVPVNFHFSFKDSEKLGCVKQKRYNDVYVACKGIASTVAGAGK
jgi:hypothetical protein